MKIEGILGFAVLLPAATSLLVSHIGLIVIAAKAQKLSRALGGDPPEYWRTRFLWGMPVPKFWDYLRTECRRSQDARLHRLVRTAEVFLVIRMVIAVPLVIALIVLEFVD